ncbi:lactose/L-arabinose transport system substrate-binding protein [Neobacillus niacini]|uniref:ABC transporter substrate-binding protein n=1 Tax=Neobacillus niacini TaxID=86668 RepID=UPI00285A29CA|nr:extracellular solute-binding protein [Neobacillus niacini]MDR7078448.1 lactose/L-arabinose transport system substrate-binding protein [Neobacillus niacini]
MKKLLALLLVSMLLLVACSSGSSNGKESKENSADANEITVWAWDPSFNIKALELAKEAYAAENPDLKVNIIENAQDDIVQKLNTSLSSGTTKGLPNIVLIEDYRAKSFLQAYPDMFHPLTGSYKTEDFVQYKVEATSVDGENYGLPFDTGVTGLYVRTDYLAEAGYTVEDLQNIDWKEYIEIGKKVKEATGKRLLTYDPNDLGILRTMIQSAGKWYVKEDGTTPDLADNEALKLSFKIYKELVDNDLMNFHSDWNEFLATFNSGKVATVTTGNWITPSIKAETSQSGKWAVVPHPSLPGMESVNASNLGGASWYVLDAPGKENAVDFLTKTFGSNVDLYQKLVTDVGAVGTYIPATKGEAYKTGDEFFGGQSIVSDFSKWAEEIPQVNYGMHTYAIEDILVVAMQNYLNGQDLDKVLKEAQEQAETQIK